MARKERLRRVHNRIWFAAAAVLFTVLAFCCAVDFMPESVALEQEVRCGTEEHVHRDECYLDDLLICGRKTHTHQDSCYLISLKNNDINSLLTSVEQQKTNKSVEGLLARILTEALSGKDGTTPAPTDDPTGTVNITALLHSGTSVSELNKLLVDSGSSVQLNVDLATSVSPMTSGDYVNLYVRLDGQLFCIGYLSLSTQTQGNGNTRYYVTEAAVADIYSAQGFIMSSAVSEDTLNSTYYLRYTSSSPTSTDDFNRGGSNNSDNISFGGGGGGGSVTTPVYAILTTRSRSSGGGPSGNSYTYTPVDFYTVSLNYVTYGAGSTNQEKIVQGSTSYTLPTSDEYYWTDANGNTITSISPTEATTVYARPKGYTVTYISDGATYTTQTGIRDGATITAPTAPTKTGYTFGGWYTDDELTDKWDFTSDTVTENITLYAKWTINQYSVTFNSNGGSPVDPQTETVSYGSKATEPTAPTRTGYTFGGWYTDDELTDKWDFTSDTVTENITLYAKWTINQYTVTFNSNGGSSVDPQPVSYGSKATQPAPTKTGYTFVGWYTDEGFTQEYDFSTPVTENITLYAKWTVNQYTVTYVDGEKTWSEVYDYGTEITLPDAENGQWWTDGTSAYEPDGSYTVTGNVTLTATDKVAATYIYKDGATGQSAAVTPGETVTLPTDIASGHVWLGSDGVTYQPGATVTLNENMTFTEKTTLTVSYDINFDTSGSGSSMYTVINSTTLYLKESAPTLVGSTPVTVAEGMSTSANTVTDLNIVVGDSSSAKRFSVIHFNGWLAEDGTTLIAPGTVLSWDELSQYDTDGDGTVSLTADWYYKKAQSVDFFIIYDSKFSVEDATAVTSAASFTPVVFSTYVGGVENDPTDTNGNYRIVYDAATDPGTYELDQRVRALYGQKDSGAWLAEFPSDEEMFAWLRNSDYKNSMSIEGTSIPAEDLTTDKYTIRWYKFQYVGSDSNYHIDGVLVKKEGQITVDKTFGGIDDAVTQAREGFYILAENGTVTDGEFTPYASDNSKYNTHVLVLDETTKTNLQSQSTYANATFQIYNSEDVNADGVMDTWMITDVELGEYWRFTEHVAIPVYTDPNTNETKNYSWYAEYTVTDTDGDHSAIAQFGSVAQVIGKTYALDEDPDQGLTVDFTNYYYANESILIRKIDGDTGQPLGGAEFQLWQPTATSNGEFRQLKFSDSGNGIYTVSSDGTIDSIITNAEGFSVITIDGFSFESGPLLVKEVTAPTGYQIVNDITVDYLNGTDGEAGITNIVGAQEDKFGYHAEYHNENGGVLVVKDHAAAYTSVTVNKQWADPNFTDDSVTVVLQATVNGVTQNAGALFPHLTGHQVTLDASSPNIWSHTWTDLPAYANGELVEWSVKEVKVGADPTLADGVSFANWIVTYSLPAKTDSNGDGVTDNWAITVTNTVRRTLLYVVKTDLAGTTALSGAEFSFTEVEWSDGAWADKSGAVALTGTTGSEGWVLFDNLTAGAFYRLTETAPPPGYLIGQESTIITLDGDGTVYLVQDGGTVDKTATLDTDYVDYAAAYVVTVKNSAMPELPSTGGTGTTVYAQAGSLLMLAALTLLVYKKKKGKGGDASEA